MFAAAVIQKRAEAPKGPGQRRDRAPEDMADPIIRDTRSPERVPHAMCCYPTSQRLSAAALPETGRAPWRESGGQDALNRVVDVSLHKYVTNQQVTRPKKLLQVEHNAKRN